MSRLPTSRKVVALTFDAGSGAEAVQSVIATLSREGVPATFFLTGEFVDLHPSAAAALAARGIVGDHTYTHPHLPQLSATALRQEVTSARLSILHATGQDPRPLFRFPYGDYDRGTLAAVNALGYVAVGWSVDTLGWKGRSAGITVGQVVDRVAAARTSGAIVLMHLGAAADGSTLDADALPRIIADARAAGYGFVTLSQLRSS